jgi:hypothetical protein
MCHCLLCEDECGSKSKKRKIAFQYYYAFLEYGFHYVTDEDGTQKPVCLICQKKYVEQFYETHKFKKAYPQNA